MDNWNHIKESGNDFWINESVGNIVKLNNGTFKAMLPKIIELGPFSSLEEAKQAIANNINNLELYLQQFNNSLINLTKEVKGG
jgi:hypothetical protein